jgi:hypothetical protein
VNVLFVWPIMACYWIFAGLFIGMFWLMRAVYWQAPRWVWRTVQRQRAARSASGGSGPRSSV